LRRRFASDLRHEPLVNLAYLGGWRRPQVIVRRYPKPDEAEMRSALDARAARAIPGRADTRMDTTATVVFYNPCIGLSWARAGVARFSA
jgi:hypothetical protein